MPKAMILAAGTGTRLMPLTALRPKALVEVAGKPLIGHVIDRLRKHGIKNIIVNLHHFAEQLQQYLRSPEFGDLEISFSDERQQLLDTGGAIRKSAWFFDDGLPFLVHNCDVVSIIPLNELIEFHQKNQAIATLAVSQRKTQRPLAFSSEGIFSGRWNNELHQRLHPLAFSGVYVLSPEIFAFMPGSGVFSIIDVLITAVEKLPVRAFEHSEEMWVDAGNRKNLEKAEQLLKNTHL
jgi:NDP-sugar pyrophosphorylase family protein